MIYAITFTEDRKVRCGLCKKRDHLARWKNYILLDEITIRPLDKETRNITYNICDFALIGTDHRINPLKVKVIFDVNGKAIDTVIPPLVEGRYMLRSSRQEVIDAILFADNEYARFGDYIPYKKGIVENEEVVQKFSSLINSL